MMPAKSEQPETALRTPLVTIKPAPGEPEVPRQMELGFMFSHRLMSQTSQQVLSAATAAFALVDLLVEKGMIEEEALKARRDRVKAVLLKQVEQTGLGLFVNESHEDKYALTELPVIDCEARLPLCRAACCALRFPLSRQDVEEGVIRWDFGRPYWNLRGRDGYCVHNDREKQSCQVYKTRPAPCRLYDCRHDTRIWLDFEARTPNPNLAESLDGGPR